MSTASQSEEKAYHQQIIPIMGLLGSISFAGLVLVLQNPSNFRVSVMIGPSFLIPATYVNSAQYFQTLVTLLMAASTLSIVGGVAAAEVSSFSGSTRLLSAFARLCCWVGIFAFFWVMPLLTYPAVQNSQLFGDILIFEGVLVVILGFLTRGFKI